MKCLLLLLLVSCGYRFSGTCDCSVSVPYVCGDERGIFTEELIRELSTHGWRYCAVGGERTLCVSFCETSRRNVGYQYDRDEEDRRTKRIVPNEGRLSAKVDVSLMEGSCTLVGPVCIETYVDYDFNPLATDTDLADFSIGQFVNIDQAEDAARKALYRRLARKIVDYVTVCH